nr:hypothetical protein [Tanacetum cinerariifolium]
MILNTLDNLRKFKAKGNGGYFIGYSMSSKAFRVFNKRTKRVEENLHVDFLENKAIEKGYGPNLLFDIDSLTKSMNYVPVVVAGTNSTNLSGTKDATSQEVKKDVSSLRYIALPNWVHDALLESPSSNAQDTCNADAPESSGNPNLTASTSNPSADQMETLTVETLIPTVSSPVLTACFENSLEPTTTTRIISKRVTSQDETLSLDTISTLANRFDDILGATTSIVDSHGEEADVSNMETTITASPTPTLRIHKDHPKIQIICPVDTPIQTRHKSKEMEEHNFIATFHQKTNPALLQFCLFSCFLSQNVWSLIDCPKGVRPIGTKWVLKNKKDERGIVIRNKARLVAQGHTQEEEIDYDEVFAHVAGIEAIRLFLSYVSFMGFTVYQMDVKSAFLYVYVMQPPGFQDLEFPARVYKVEKAIYGLHQAPRAWLSMPCDVLLREISSSTLRFNKIMERRQFCDYHNMVAILEKSEHNIDFHPIVDFVEASPLSLQRKQSDLVSKFEAQEVEITMLKARVKLLEDKERGGAKRSGDDAPLKGRRLDEGEEAAEKGSNYTEEMINVLTSIDAATVLSSRVAEVPTGSGSIPTAGPPAAGLIFATATVVTPYTRRKGKEKMIESETPKKKKIQEQMDIQMAR